MAQITSKSGLAIELSGLKGFEKPKVRDEQYMTEPEIAAEMLWLMHMRGELDGKVVADLGAGTGMLGIGALILGARKVFLVEKDRDAMAVLKQNLDSAAKKGIVGGEAVPVLSDIADFNEKVDVVVENPPFGTRQEHIDRMFLGKAFSIAQIVWSFHKESTSKFVEAFAKDSGFAASPPIKFRFPLHAAHEFHKRRIHRIDVSLYRLEKA